MMARMLRHPAKKGRVLAVKWGLNPNSSSLGVDVTFLLLGAAALSVTTPFVSALVRLRLARKGPAHTDTKTADAPQAS